MMASKSLTTITLVMLALACLVSTVNARQCTYDCDWKDEELTLCDDRFVYIFSGKVVRVFSHEQTGLTDYDVEITKMFRGDDKDMYEGFVVTLRTKHTTKICQVRDMAEGQDAYFAVGALNLETYRIFVDACNSYIKLPSECDKVLADLLNGDFKEPC